MANKKDTGNDKDFKEIESKIKNLQKFENMDEDSLVKHTNKLGELLKENKVSSSQIRKIFREVKKLQFETKSPSSKSGFNPGRVKLLKPKIAYLAGREPKLKGFKRVMDAAIDKVHDIGDFGRLTEFMEAVMAYHKCHEGPD